MFKQQGSPQANAAPLQSMVKRHNLGQKTPTGSTAMENPFVPRAKAQALGGPSRSPMPMPGFDPVFMHILAQMMFGGKK